MMLVTTDKEYVRPLAKNRTTGIIHRVLGASSWCGASRKNSIITLDQAMKADESRFCAKCFGSKPANFYEVIQ